MVTKKVLISGLAIASLALTGCSAIQTAINNKIASTAKEVSGNINSEVAKTTDALKAQGEKMQSDFGAAADQLKKEFGVMTTYTNTEFGFSLQFPQSWGTVVASKVVGTNAKGDSNGRKTFNISSGDKTKTYTIVLGLTANKSKDMLSDADGLVYLGKTKTYDVYGDNGYAGPDTNDDQVKEFKLIGQSFKAL